MRKGDPVRLSEIAIKRGVSPKLADRKGKVYKDDPNKAYIHVLWDGNKKCTTYAREFIVYDGTKEPT